MKNTFRISPAHIEYLEHQEGRRLGSSTDEETRCAIFRMLRGELPERKPTPAHRQMGQEFLCLNRPRERVSITLTRAQQRQLFNDAIARPGETALEVNVRAHAEKLGYRLTHHTCDKWCAANCAGPK